MGRSGISREDVYSAAQIIAESGEFPTMHLVRVHIGTGSFGTIHKFLQAWKQERLIEPATKLDTSKSAAKIKNLIDEKAQLADLVARQSSQILNLEQKIADLKAAHSESMNFLMQASQDLFIDERLKNMSLREQIKNLAANIKQFAEAVRE